MNEKKKYVERERIIEIFKDICVSLKSKNKIDEEVAEQLYSAFEDARKLDYIEIEIDDSEYNCPFYKPNKRLKYMLNAKTGKPDGSYIESYGICTKVYGSPEVKCNGIKESVDCEYGDVVEERSKE